MNDIEEIKSKIDIVEFIGQYVTLKKSGSNYKAPCPFHQEKTPSFMVSHDKQIYKCFGCQAGGDVIEFLMKQENLEFREALQILADKVGVQLEKSKPKAVYEEEKNTKQRLIRINALAALFYHKILLNHPAGQIARDYLGERKLTNEVIKQFQIGYAPRKDVLTSALARRGFGPAELREAGSPEMFHHRITFPMFDQTGNVVGFSARALDVADEPKYLNTRETTLFHKSRVLYGLHQAKQAIKENQQAVIVEGQMDVVLSHQAGVANVVASSGTALTADHLTILSRLTPNIVFAFDADAAGTKAAMTAIEMALTQELTIRMVEFPEGIKDTGELVAKDPAAWGAALKSAVTFIEWLFNRLAPQPIERVEEKKAIAKQLVPFLTHVSDPVEQSTYLRLLAQKLNVSEKSITDLMGKIAARVGQSEGEARPISQKASIESTLYGLLTSYPQFQKNHTALYQALSKWYNKESAAIELMIGEQYKGFSEEAIELEIAQLISRLRERKKEKIKTEFAEKISQAQQQGNTKVMKELLSQLQQKIS